MKPTMKEFNLEADNRTDVAFTGLKLASVKSRDYNNRTDRWTELHLYRTQGGKYVVQTLGMTSIQGEHVKRIVDIASNLAELYEICGHGWLAKYLYQAAGLSDVQRID